MLFLKRRSLYGNRLKILVTNNSRMLEMLENKLLSPMDFNKFKFNLVDCSSD